MSEKLKKFEGKYVLESSENMEEFLAANGVPWMVRKMASKTTPTVEMRHKKDADGDDVVEAKTTSLMFTSEVRISDNKDFEEKQPNGVVMKISPSWDGDLLVLNYRPKESGAAKNQRMTRQIVEDKLIMTMEIDNVVAKRIFRKISD